MHDHSDSDPDHDHLAEAAHEALHSVADSAQRIMVTGVVPVRFAWRTPEGPACPTLVVYGHTGDAEDSAVALVLSGDTARQLRAVLASPGPGGNRAARRHRH